MIVATLGFRGYPDAKTFVLVPFRDGKMPCPVTRRSRWVALYLTAEKVCRKQVNLTVVPFIFVILAKVVVDNV